MVVKKESYKAGITFDMKCQQNYRPLFACIIIFIGD